jgi:Family of unknown function (DUF5947)
MSTTTGALDRAVRRAAARREATAGQGSAPGQGSAARGAATGERCDLCGLPVPDEHRHLHDDDRGELLCACRACSVLFERSAAGGRHYRLVPERRVRLTAGASPEDLGVPVGLAFFVKARDGSVTARYPSPMGTTQYEVQAGAWTGMVRRHPELGSMQPDVEAFLVNTARGADERWIVPVDLCYRLVAVIKGTWKGLSGGSLVWQEIERFFAQLTEAR